MRKLICDLYVYDDGHHIAYVNSIMTWAADREDLIFLFNKDAATFCPCLAGDERVHFVDEDFLAKNRENVLRGKWREYQYIRQFAIRQAIEKVIFLEIDQYQLAIGLIPSPFRITGIIFRSFHKIRVMADSLPATLKNAIYRAKKRLMFRVFRLNRKVEPLFLLNDRAGCTRYPDYFTYLPDPVFPHQPKTGRPSGPDPGGSRSSLSSSPDVRSFYRIPATTHIFLVSGAMGGRKNIRHIVDAYQQASLDHLSVLLIAGKVRADYRVEFDAAINSYTSQDPRKRMIVVDEFIDDDRLDAWFRDSDTIVLCYRKFYGSSGLMGKAAEHGKTCIVPDQGLLFDLCRQYSLGYTADPEDIESIAAALSLAQKSPQVSAGHNRFVQDHSEHAFLATLLP